MCLHIYVYMDIVRDMFAFPFSMSLYGSTHIKVQRDHSPETMKECSLVFAGLRIDNTVWAQSNVEC